MRERKISDRMAHIEKPRDVWWLMKARAEEELVENVWTIILDTQNNVRKVESVSRGTLNQSLIHPREVFRLAVIESAAGIIVVHNHPSGNPAPSADDRAITRQLVEAGRVLDIPLHDHVIVTGEGYFSFAEAGLL